MLIETRIIQSMLAQNLINISEQDREDIEAYGVPGYTPDQVQRAGLTLDRIACRVMARSPMLTSWYSEESCLLIVQRCFTKDLMNPDADMSLWFEEDLGAEVVISAMKKALGRGSK